MAPGVQNERKRVAQGSKTMQKGRPAAAEQAIHFIAGWTARGCGGMTVVCGETTAGGLLERCRPTARKLPGWTCRESARDPQGLCKRIAGNLQGNCRETARELAGHLQEMCEGIAGNLRKDRNRTARALQEICRGPQGNCKGTARCLRGPCLQGIFIALRIACRGTAETLPDGCQTIKLSVCCQS